MTELAIVLSLLNACCYAAGARLQYDAIHQVSPEKPTALSAVVRRPRWLAGLALLGAGTTLHIMSLRLAPVTVVQPLGVGAVVLSVLWGLRVRRTGLDRATGLALAAIVVGTGTFAVIASGATVATSVTTTAQFQAGALVLLIVTCCAGLSNVLPGQGRCVARAVGAGSAYGCMSVLLRAAGEEFTSSGVSGALCGTLAGLGLAALAGFWLTQGAQAAGPPEVTVACLTLVDPFVAVVIGVGLLGEAPGLAPATVGTALACWALALTGVLHITRSTPFPHLDTGCRPSAPPTYVLQGPRSQRIVIGADTFPPDVNGAANFTQRLAEGLLGRGHEVHIVCPATEAGPGTAVEKGITVHRIASHRTPFHPTFRQEARVLFVGRLDKEKNIHELLRALALLPGVRGEIVGEGSCRRALEELAHDLGIADRVTFHGLATDQEALDALAHALTRLLRDPVARPRMGEAGREIVAEHDIRRTLAAFEDLYLRAAGGSAAVAGTLATPVPEGEHDEYTARSGRR
ncbi:glycosyltransferase [Streptomyces sp. NPDC058256]|uniref:glycosyltransferase n=1 Tax=Streptomyces sp. NPDC058256 TaxID=3346408 RepID=UPI0036E082F0